MTAQEEQTVVGGGKHYTTPLSPSVSDTDDTQKKAKTIVIHYLGRMGEDKNTGWGERQGQRKSKIMSKMIKTRKVTLFRYRKGS